MDRFGLCNHLGLIDFGFGYMFALTLEMFAFRVKPILVLASHSLIYMEINGNQLLRQCIVATILDCQRFCFLGKTTSLDVWVLLRRHKFSRTQQILGNSIEAGYPNNNHVMFDMDTFGVKKLTCAEYQESGTFPPSPPILVTVYSQIFICFHICFSYLGIMHLSGHRPPRKHQCFSLRAFQSPLHATNIVHSCSSVRSRSALDLSKTSFASRCHCSASAGSSSHGTHSKSSSMTDMTPA